MHIFFFENRVADYGNFMLMGTLQLVVIHADLIGHLKALKDYFLLAKGDFFQVSFVHFLSKS